MKAGIRHEYRLVLRLGQDDDYPSAVRSSWRFFYDVYKPGVVWADLKKVYADSVDLLSTYAKFVNGAPGFPFTVDLAGTPGMYCYQMGFTGAALPCAYHLLRGGNSHDKAMADAIIDFWVSSSYEGSDELPHTWYQPSMPADAGPGPHWGVMATERFWRDEPQNGQVFLRTLSEGHLAVLRAWDLERGHDDWLRWTRRFGDWLVQHQNADGSFYRKYDVSGKPLQMTTDNTSHAIPFLSALYRATGDDSYRKAAISAGNYAWDSIHNPACYVGGTPDNPNVTDKEAAQLALEGFLSLYDATKDAKWLDAAKRAADFVETWVYVWDVPMPDGDEAVAVFDRINTAGLSLVAAGHSYADCADASSAYAFDRLYRLTGDRHYRDMSLILLHNTKQFLDTDGSKGYAHPGLQVEGIGLSLLRGRGARVWLPWCTFAQIDSIPRMGAASDE